MPRLMSFVLYNEADHLYFLSPRYSYIFFCTVCFNFMA